MRGIGVAAFLIVLVTLGVAAWSAVKNGTLLRPQVYDVLQIPGLGRARVTSAFVE
jgi:hypothetical protein